MSCGIEAEMFGSLMMFASGVLASSPTVYRARFPPALTYARVPSCVVRAYARPASSTFREDRAAARD